MADHYKIKHQVMKLSWLQKITKTALVDQKKKLPHLTNKELDDPEGVNSKSADAVWVPNRNGVFINIAAAIAESFNVQQIITGFNWEEAQTFPDNSPEYISAVNGSLSFSTQNLVEVKSYISELTKTEIVEIGQMKKAPLHLIWSCYDKKAKMCWNCESCQRLKRSLEKNKLWEWFKKEGKNA
jgi:7-cyano-7-deazaguanine synthase